MGYPARPVTRQIVSLLQFAMRVSMIFSTPPRRSDSRSYYRGYYDGFYDGYNRGPRRSLMVDLGACSGRQMYRVCNFYEECWAACN